MKYIATAHHFLLNLGRDEKGVTAVEYGLIAALIAAVIIAGVSLLGTNIKAVFNTIASTI
jgi:pilus assembly protein Flp/PilA